MADDEQCRSWINMGITNFTCDREPYHVGQKHHMTFVSMGGAKVHVEWELESITATQFANARTNTCGTTAGRRSAFASPIVRWMTNRRRGSRTGLSSRGGCRDGR